MTTYEDLQKITDALWDVKQDVAFAYNQSEGAVKAQLYLAWKLLVEAQGKVHAAVNSML